MHDAMVTFFPHTDELLAQVDDSELSKFIVIMSGYSIILRYLQLKG